MTTLAQQLASFAVSATVPDEILASIPTRFLDTVGVSLGALPLDTSAAAIAHALELGGAPQASIIGSPTKVPAPTAAFVNGVLAHSLDYDDTHLPSILHPSASIVPAALAAAQLVRANGAQMARAAAIGIEICCRLGMAGYLPDERSSIYFERGQHATSICGTAAGAVAAALLLGLDDPGIVDAIGIAVSMGSGVIEANRTGGTIKRLHCGIAAQSALSAAMLAKRGITGPPTSLEGRFGFLQAWLGDRARPVAITEGLGERWEAARIFVKPYPCNHFTHPCIDAAISARHMDVHPGDIESVTVGVASQTVRTIGEPLDEKRTPDTGYLAKFSGPYTVAAALVSGGLGLDDFTDGAAASPERRALAAKVTIVGDPRCDEIYPDQFPASFHAVLKDGTEFRTHVGVTRGGPERPLTDEELAAKFRDCALRVLTDDDAALVEDACSNLDALTSVDPILEPTTRAKEG